MKKQTIPALTGVRGVAALWVFWFHFSGFAANQLQVPSLSQWRISAEGFRGVDLFFLLSGFILLHVHDTQFVKLDGKEATRFYILRFFRVYPLNTVILLAMVPFVLLFPDFVAASRVVPEPHYSYKVNTYSFGGFVQNLLLVQTWTYAKLGEWNGPSWTLSAEVLGYAVFPLLANRMERLKSASVCLLLSSVCLLLLIVVMVISHHAFTYQNPSGTIGAARMLFEFTAGMLLQRHFRLQPVSVIGPDLMCGSALTFLAVMLYIPAVALFSSFAFGILILGLAYNTGHLMRLFDNRVSILLGLISFSLYLTHGFIISFAAWAISRSSGTGIAFGITNVVTVLLLCFLAAILTYNLVERPSQRLGWRIAETSRSTRRQGDEAKPIRAMTQEP